MNILFYCPWSNKKKWLQSIMHKFKGQKIYTLKDKFNYQDIEYAIIWNLPNNIFSKLTNLKLIFSLGAGVDHILNLPSYKDTPILRVKDLNMAKRMSNHVLSQILNYQLKLKLYEQGRQKKKWLEEKETLHNYKITIGILGVGFLGKAVGNFLQKLGYKLIGFKNSPIKYEKNFPIYTERKINLFLKNSDIIVSILPSTSQTVDFINQSFLKKMKKNALLINVGRGDSVNEEHLIKHLKMNKSFFASLDVFKKEPLPKNHKLWKLPNVTITPHIAAITDIEEAVSYMYNRFIFLRKKRYFKGDIDLKKGY